MGFGYNWRSGTVRVRHRALLYTLLGFEVNIPLRPLLGGGASLSGYAACHKDGVLNFRDMIAILQNG
jgi:hypothetical protein